MAEKGRRLMKRRKTSKSLLVSDDLLLEVLRILEAKSVLRFRCVSKSWNSIISDPSFARLHFKRSRLLLLDGNERDIFRTADCDAIKLGSSISIEACGRRCLPFEVTSDLIIWGSCDGIVCFGVGKNDANLWNPTTGEVYFLPKPQHRKGWYHRFGFGWDKSVNDYKVVRVSSSKSLVRSEVEVLSLKSRTWVKRVPGVDLRFDLDLNLKIIYCNGALHWMASTYSSRRPSFRTEDYLVARFDLADGNLQKLLLPDDLNPSNIGTLDVLGDHLCLCSGPYGTRADAKCSIDVQVMKESSVWIQFTADIYFPPGLLVLDSYAPHLFTTDGVIFGVANGCLVVKSNTNSGTSTILIEASDMVGDMSDTQICEAIVYSETTVSLMALANTP